MGKNIAGLYKLFAYTHVVFFVVIITLSGAEECKYSISDEKCCAGHRKINGTCEECIGFYGKDCGIPCPKKYYGPRCITPCNCSENETCNQFVGCILLSTFETKYRKSIHNKSCFSLFLLVIALTGSQIVTLICCLKTLRWKDCRLSPKQAKASSRHCTGMHASQTNISMSEGGNEPSKPLGSSCEGGITNGIHCHTDIYQNCSKCHTDIYDSFETADRIKKA